MRGAVITGAVGGLAGGALQLAAMFTDLSYAAWDRANGALFVAFCLAVIALGVHLGRAGRAGTRLLAPVAVAVTLCAALNLLTYAVATGPFAEQVRQLPLFANDPTYRGYPSPAAYLTTAGNYGALFRLQMFTWIVVALLQMALGGAAALASATRWRRRARADATG